MKARLNEKGQSIVEMAFILPIMALFLIVVIDAARAFDAYIVLTNATREGARYGSYFQQDGAVTVATVQQTVVEDVLGSGTNLTRMEQFSAANVTVVGLSPGSTEVIVTATYDFPLYFGGLVGLGTFHLSKQAVMPVP
jgi:Flp pilus assembly protein TadG